MLDLSEEMSDEILTKCYKRFLWLPLMQAEWLAAQQDERAMAGFQDEGDDGVSFFEQYF